MARTGIQLASVSIDGLAPTHDLMRATKGGFESARLALRHLKEAGIAIAANTNVNRLNQADLEGLYDFLKDEGVGSWQVHLTTPQGRAADRPDFILQPYDLLHIVPRIAALKAQAFKDGILLMPGNNLGYFGPEEAMLRSPHLGGRDHFLGCQAGRYVLGIESNGGIKGCPSLEASHYVGGTLENSHSLTYGVHPPSLGFRAFEIRVIYGAFARRVHLRSHASEGALLPLMLFLGGRGTIHIAITAHAHLRSKICVNASCSKLPPPARRSTMRFFASRLNHSTALIACPKGEVTFCRFAGRQRLKPFPRRPRNRSSYAIEVFSHCDFCKYFVDRRSQ